MQFHDYTTLYQIAHQRGLGGKARATARDWYRQQDLALFIDPVLSAQFTLERRWLDDRRPYYDVYPAIVSSLLRLRLDLDCGLVRLPLPALVVRFGVGQEPDLHGYRLRCLMLGEVLVRYDRPGMLILCDFGERPSGIAAYSYRAFETTPGRSLEESLNDSDHLDPYEKQHEAAVTDCVRLACTLCLLGEDPEIIEPEPLVSDRRKYEETADPALIEKAIRRGKRSWSVGRRITIDPHFRRPHVALRWTGEGRTIPRIVPVKGSIVHRSRVVAVPTGRMDD